VPLATACLPPNIVNSPLAAVLLTESAAPSSDGFDQRFVGALPPRTKDPLSQRTQHLCSRVQPLWKAAIGPAWGERQQTAFIGLNLQGILPKPSTYKSIKFITSSIHHPHPKNKKTHGFRRGPNEPTQVQESLLLCGLQNA
jgi:hypothetical protein